MPGGCAARLWKTGYVIDLHCLPLLVDRVEHAVPAGPQAPQIRRPVRERDSGGRGSPVTTPDLPARQSPAGRLGPAPVPDGAMSGVSPTADPEPSRLDIGRTVIDRSLVATAGP